MISYPELFRLFIEQVFSNWSNTVLKKRTDQNEMIRELIDDPRVQAINLDREIWSDFLKYHQMFDLTYSLLKENLEKFLLQKTEIFLEKLIYASQAESETDDNRTAADFKNLKFKKLMPWLQVFYTELIKTFILSIGEILDSSNP